VHVCGDSLDRDVPPLNLGTLDLDVHAQTVLFMAQSTTQGPDRVTPNSSCRKLYRKEPRPAHHWTKDGLQWEAVSANKRLGQLPPQERGLEFYLVERSTEFVLVVIGQDYDASAQYKPDTGIILELQDDLDNALLTSIVTCKGFKQH